MAVLTTDKSGYSKVMSGYTVLISGYAVLMLGYTVLVSGYLLMSGYTYCTIENTVTENK
jgi:hypothetical protein